MIQKVTTNQRVTSSHVAGCCRTTPVLTRAPLTRTMAVAAEEGEEEVVLGLVQAVDGTGTLQEGRPRKRRRDISSD